MSEEFKTLKENIERDRIAKKLREIPEEHRTLKTLKEICKSQVGQPQSNAILKEFEGELKKEAIKWVKEWEMKSLRLIKEASNYLEIYYRMQGKIRGFKYFFNISKSEIENA